MRRGRLAWWIALLGGVIAFIATVIIVSFALFADPGFIDNVSPQNLPQPTF
jgi:Na+/H+-dicarboxylate symporter